MDSLYRGLTLIALWLGIVSVVLAVGVALVGSPFPFRLTPGGMVRGAQALFLLAVAAYCAFRTLQRS